MQPKIDEYVTGDGWTLTCKELGCKWVAYGERTENFIEEMHEDLNRHIEEHRSMQQDAIEQAKDN